MTEQQFNILFNKAKDLMKRTKDLMHDWSHVKRVIDNAFKIKNSLPKEKQRNIDDKLLTIACAWHDISYVYYKLSFSQYLLEGKRSAKICKEYLERNRVDKEEINLIFDIILHHPHGVGVKEILQSPSGSQVYLYNLSSE